LSLDKLLQQIDHCRCLLILAFQLAMIWLVIIDWLLGEGNVFSRLKLEGQEEQRGPCLANKRREMLSLPTCDAD
jgi:hypothetical protein